MWPTVFFIAQDPPGADVLLGTWAQIFTGLDIVTMVGIGILAFTLTRSFAVTEQRAVLIPTALGFFYGAVTAWDESAGQSTAHVTVMVFKGLMFNGAGATLVGRITAFLVERWWPSPAGQFRDHVDEVARKISAGTLQAPKGVDIKPPKDSA